MSDDIARKRARLRDLVAERSFSIGKEMTLASGRKSNFYFNMKPTMLHPEGAALIAALILDRLRAHPADFVGGLELGAVPIACAVSAMSHAEGTPIPALIIRKQTKGHGTQQRIEGIPPGDTLAGRKVLMVEDVTTTGGSLLDAVEVVREAGGMVERAITIVDRLEGAAEQIRAQGLDIDPLLTANDFLES